LLSRLDADEAAVAAPVQKLHVAGDHREERVVLAPPDVLSPLMLVPRWRTRIVAGVNKLSTGTP